MCSSTDSDPRIGEAAVEAQSLDREKLNWYKQMYDDDILPQQKEEQALNRKVTQQALEAATVNQGLAFEQANTSRDLGRPIEQAIAKDAMDYSEPAKIEEIATRAGADTSVAFDDNAMAVTEELARRGITPSGGASVGMMQNNSLAKAAGMAMAQNQARVNANVMGGAKRKDAAALMRGMATDAVSASQAATQGNATAAGITAMTGNSIRANSAGMNGAYQQGVSNTQGAVNLLQSSDNARRGAEQSNNAQTGAAVGTAISVAVMI